MIRHNQNNLEEPAQFVVAADLRLGGNSDCCAEMGTAQVLSAVQQSLLPSVPLLDTKAQPDLKTRQKL